MNRKSIDFIVGLINDQGMNDIQQILIDMTKLSPIRVYKKHGVGIQTQTKIKESIVADFMKYVARNCCVLCKKRLKKH